jgi:hypothetical protein
MIADIDEKGKALRIRQIVDETDEGFDLLIRLNLAGVLSLTKRAAVELAPFGIRVNAICPGTIPTSLADKMGITAEQRSKLGGLQPMGRVGLPSEISVPI